MAYQIKRGDRRPYFRVQLKQTDPASPTGALIPVDLTGAVAVKFLMKPAAGALKVNATGFIVSATTGVVEYRWGATDTDTSGTFNMEVEVDWGGGEKQTFPSSSYFPVTISDDLG